MELVATQLSLHFPHISGEFIFRHFFKEKKNRVDFEILEIITNLVKLNYNSIVLKYV